MKKYAFNDDSFLKSIALKLLTLQRCGVDIIAEYFDFYRGGKDFDFDIYHIKSKFLPKGFAAGTIELAVLRKMPKAHAHHLPGTSWFFFLDDNCALDMGGARDEESSVLTRMKMQAHVFYPVPPFVFHAAGPLDGAKETRLLIFNPQGLRPRPLGSTYAVDTFEKQRTVLWDEVSQVGQQLTRVPPKYISGYTRAGAMVMILVISFLMLIPMFTAGTHQTATRSNGEDSFKDFLRDCDMWLVQQARQTGDTRYLAAVGTAEAATAVYGSDF